MIAITDEIHLLSNARLDKITDNMEIAFWRRIKPLVHGYCSKRERAHQTRDFELRWYDEWYHLRSLLRWFGIKKKCRYCGARITPGEYNKASMLENLRDDVLEHITKQSGEADGGD